MNKLQERINERFPQERIDVLHYTIMKEPARVRCLQCGTEYEMAKGESFLKSTKKCICRRCINNGSGGRKTLEQFQAMIDEKYPQEQLQVLNYLTQKDPCSIKCLACGEVFTLTAAESFLSKDKHRVCKKCLPNKIKYLNATKDNFFEWAKASDLFEIISTREEIINSDYLVKGKCLLCGKINEKSMYDYMRGRGCSCQGNNVKLTNEDIQADLPVGFTVIESNGSTGRMLIKHSCGFIFERNGRKRTKVLCPKCDKTVSLGEKRILTMLDEKGVKYVSQYKKTLDGHNLRFDFYLPDYDLYIEFQGEQHYYPIKRFGGQEAFEKQRYRDNLKREFCGNKLLEISYIDIDRIEEILSDLLKFND